MRAARRVRTVVIGVVAVTAAAAIALPGVALASSRTAHVEASRTLAAPELPLGARVTSATPATERLSVSLFLQPRNAAALAAFAASVSDVHSPMFRHYLARGEFASKFGPTAATIASVERFARDAGLSVASLSSNHLDLSLRGTAARFSSAFSTHLSNVRLGSGELGRTTTAVHLPASIASSVEAVIGLSDLLHAHTSLERLSDLKHPTLHGAGRSFPNDHPAGAPGAPSACPAATISTELGYGGITDDQVAQAYGVDGLYSAGDLGAGQTVAVFELEPFALSDVAAFDTCYFGSSHTSQIKVDNVDGGPGVGEGSGESALDIENVSAIAPAAHVIVYQAPNTNYGSIDAYNRIVSDDIAQTATSSWGFCESDQQNFSPGALAAENLIFEQAAAQGQTVLNSAGDGGDDSCSYQNGYPSSPVLTQSDPASQPYVLGVGGTTAVSVTQPPEEQVWNDGALGGGGGGGVSRLWTQPPWIPKSDNHLSNSTFCGAPAGEVCRTVPDVTAFADEFTGITIEIGGGWYTIGGTSSSSPLWAAMLAEINASPTCQSSSSTTRGVGFASPLLYDVASNPTDYASGFNDVTLGNNDIYNLEHGTYAAGPGYDLASGLGSPELTPAPGVVGPGLAQSLCTAAQGATTATVTSIAPPSGPPTGGTAFTITGTGFYSGATPDVSAVSFGTSPAASFVVQSNTEITGTTASASTPTTSKVLNDLTSKSGGVLVSVTTTDGSVAIGPSFHYVVQHGGKTVPTLFQVGPTGGPKAGANTVDLYGTGFTGATKVTFGGVATTFKVLSDVQIAAKAPKLATATKCLAASKGGKLGICQAEVQVTGPGGASTEVPALKPYEGFLNPNQIGLIGVPKNCKCEAYPTVTEYDYTTTFSLSKVVGQSGKPIVGDPGGGDIVDLDGTGMNVLTYNWANFGPASSEYSTDYDAFSIDPTSVQVFSSGDPNPGPNGDTIPVSFTTVSGPSNAKSFTYGAIPVVTSLSTEVVPAAGGTTLTINGGGFKGVEGIELAPYSFNDPPVLIEGNFKVVSTTKITMTSPSMVPGAYEVVVCQEDDCGSGSATTPPSAVTVNAIFPGATAVTSADTDPASSATPSGPVAGGTTFEVQGTNFGSLSDLTVSFVNELGDAVATTSVVAGPAPTDPGATQTILVTTPASLGGVPAADQVVLSGDNGASAEFGPAFFFYE